MEFTLDRARNARRIVLVWLKPALAKRIRVCCKHSLKKRLVLSSLVLHLLMAMIEPCFGIGSNNSWRQRETEQGKAGC